jgi:urease gamma subunit
MKTFESRLHRIETADRQNTAKTMKGSREAFTSRIDGIAKRIRDGKTPSEVAEMETAAVKEKDSVIQGVKKLLNRA